MSFAQAKRRQQEFVGYRQTLGSGIGMRAGTRSRQAV
jgi:hypothetical protein